jgi:hypothetical protein
MPKKRALDGTEPWRASVPKVVEQRGKFTLRSRLKSETGNSSGTEVSVSGYPSLEAATADLEIFQFAVHLNRAKDWGPPNASGPRSARYKAQYTTFEPPTHSMFDSNLNTAQESQLKKIRKDDPTVTRQQFKEEVVNATPSGKERFLRNLARSLLGIATPDREVDARLQYLTDDVQQMMSLSTSWRRQ